jgi:hypothetical protein
MSRKTLTRTTRRIGIALAIAALAVPAAAQAHPVGLIGQAPGSQSTFVPTDPGQQRIAEQGTSRNHPYVPVSIGQPATASAVDDSGFQWSDALIGAGITAAVLLLAFGGATVARRQGRRLGYR